MNKQQAIEEIGKSDKSKCFICQKLPPTKKATRDEVEFLLCDNCAQAVEQENNTRNRVKAALHQNDTRHIFQYTLGMNLTSIKIEICKLYDN
jgi:hypothetical protein